VANPPWSMARTLGGTGTAGGGAFAYTDGTAEGAPLYEGDAGERYEEAVDGGYEEEPDGGIPLYEADVGRGAVP
jgi:hypothetical protein